METYLPHEIERGAFAYEAYKRASAGRSLITGELLPDFLTLSADVQTAWILVADAVCAKFGAIY
jgi:hypothetical protein